MDEREYQVLIFPSRGHPTFHGILFDSPQSTNGTKCTAQTHQAQQEGTPMRNIGHRFLLERASSIRCDTAQNGRNQEKGDWNKKKRR